jgi:molybdate transport system substrate-binding protein
MATRALLDELAARWNRQADVTGLEVESVGGVDAARRVEAGEAFDLVVLAAHTIDRLIASGRVVAGSRADLVHSGVAVAVRAAAPRPDIGNEEALRAAVLAARTVGVSTGPSGVELLRLFERWGVADTLRERIVQAPPGVPVGELVARGEVELGFQQLSELMRLPGIELLGPLPQPVQIVTTFSAGLCSACARPKEATLVLEYLRSPSTAECKRGHGMQPA